MVHVYTYIPLARAALIIPMNLLKLIFIFDFSIRAAKCKLTVLIECFDISISGGFRGVAKGAVAPPLRPS